MATIRKRGRRWEAQVRKAGVTSVNKSFLNKADADRWARQTEAAIESFKQAVALEDSLDYDEPEPLPFAARHWLGQALLDADQPIKAEAVFRAELKDHPHNGWSLFGLQQALAAQGVSDNSVNDNFEQSWSRADIWLTGSKF